MKDACLFATQKWLESVVIGLNICPFAKKVFDDKRIRFQVELSEEIEQCLENFIDELAYLDDNENTQTTLICYANYLKDFNEYLDFVAIAQALLVEQGYEGIYQIATFHPLYLFEDAHEEDAANFTNRSPYPMIHVLREDHLTQALAHFQNPERIPDANIAFMRQLGLEQMRQRLNACYVK